MIIGVLKETLPGENRVSCSPNIVATWVNQGLKVMVETNAGINCAYTNENYEEKGATVTSIETVLTADILVAINPLNNSTVQALKSGQYVVSIMNHKSNEAYVKAVNEKNVNYFSLDAIPRISRAQSMDVLSSQANLAGYKAVLLGANHLNKIFPLMMTAAGTITPSRVLIFGVGVAGLQAIATAKRLGAIVEATDVRPETKEQVESLGGKFITVEGSTVSSQGGYAGDASEEYKELQRQAVNKSLAQADLVITTAQVPGKKAPLLINEEQLSLMKNGAVVVDMAAAQGGNCAKTVANEVTVVNGVTLVGTTNLPSLLATNASELFAKNIDAFLQLIIKNAEIVVPMEDEIIKACLICNSGNRLTQ